MKKGFATIIAVTYIFCFQAICQNRDNIWMLGGATINPYYPKGGLDFNSGDADTFSVVRPLPFFNTNAGICDTLGQELFYTNGIWIENKNHDTLQNSWMFNPGTFTDEGAYSGLGLTQACLIVPRPLHESEYYLFHVSGEFYLHNGQSDGGPLNFSYSLVDMNLDSGLGGIPADKKSIHLIDDSVMQGRITACKHANGRDWWVVTKENYTNKYYKFLVTPDTIQLFEQYVGFPLISNDVLGMAVFSPDGSKYAIINNDNTAELYDFDRCTGELSNPVALQVSDSLAPWLSLGGAFSPNSRFFYANTYKKIWQYDTWANDVQTSAIKVAEWDSANYYGINMWFFQEQLAPDNRIYVSTYNGLRTVHYINYPDSLGIDCNVIQHGLDLSTANLSLPNLPNYGIGPLAGSPCDTLLNHFQTIAQDFQIKFSPNPASSLLNIEYHSNEVLQFKLFDVIGVLKKEITLYPYFRNRMLHVEDLAEGIYLAVVTSQDKIVKTEKVVVQY